MNQRIEPNFGGAAPPPLPPRPQSPLPPPKRGMSGCLIALIVCGVLAVPTIGILAAIAIPQYQSYVGRSKALQASMLAQSLRTEVEDFYIHDGECPGDGDIDLQAHGVTSNPVIASITFGESGEGRCNVKLILQGQAKLEGKHITWERDPSNDPAEWHCASDLEMPYLPPACRP